MQLILFTRKFKIRDFLAKIVRDTLMADDPFTLPSHDPNHYVNGETTFHFVLVFCKVHYNAIILEEFRLNL